LRAVLTGVPRNATNFEKFQKSLKSNPRTVATELIARPDVLSSSFSPGKFQACILPYSSRWYGMF